MGRKRVSQGLGNCQHNRKALTIIIPVIEINLVLPQGCGSGSKILSLPKSIEKMSLTLVHSGYLMNLKRVL